MSERREAANPGGAIVRAGWIADAMFLVTAVPAAIAGNDAVDAVAIAVALLLFFVGIGTFVYAFAVATVEGLEEFAHSLAQEPREAAVFEDPAAGLALGAVVDRVLLEVDACDRCAAHVARLAELVVHAARPLVVRAALA